MWRGIWLPVVPALLIAALLCGWAVAEPDPVPQKVPTEIVLMSIPFLALCARALIRAGWSLFSGNADVGTATVGLLKPWIVFSPRLAKRLEDRAVEAALEHERAHVRHRDPLRICLAQLVTDLQWPWPQAQKRFRAWLAALELARDEEARLAGVQGADLASAILVSVRACQGTTPSPIAALNGDRAILEKRVHSLLGPVADLSKECGRSSVEPGLLGLGLLLAVALGIAFGDRLIRLLLHLAV
jgi:hypothetical protein